jgi:hypothetical protein
MTQSVQRRGTGWTARVRFPTVERELSLLHIVQIGSGIYSTFCSMGSNGSFTGEKRLGHEAGHSAPSSVEWSYTSTIPYVFMA